MNRRNIRRKIKSFPVPNLSNFCDLELKTGEYMLTEASLGRT